MQDASGPFISYAQNLEDVMLWRALGDAVAGPGRYVDVGAADPTDLSVTRAFYDRGWRGVNVEPLPEQAALLQQARPGDVVVQAALAAAPGMRRFHRVVAAEQTGLSTLDAAEAARHAGQGARVETLDVPVMTLAALCAVHVDGPVHFLKIDVEGAEAEVLAGADFSAVRPWIVLVEATRPASGEASEAAWEPGLLAAGYRFVWFDGLNRFYLAQEHAALARHFQVPPNVFDQYRQWDPPLQSTLRATEALAAARLAAMQDREAEFDGLRQALATAEAAARARQAEDERAAERAAAEQAEAEQKAAELAAAARAEAEAAAQAAEQARARRASGLRGLVRRAGMMGWRLVRPVARPLLWRGRQFLVGDLQREMAALRAQQDLALDFARLLADRPSVVAGAGGPALDSGVAQAMERLLLTLALQDGREPDPPGLAPALSNPVLDR